MMHAALVPNESSVVYFGYGDTRDDLSRVWDYSVDPGAYSLPANQPFDVTQPAQNRPLANIWSAEHAYLADAEGSLVVHGGFTPRQTFVFDPVAKSWSRKQPTAQDRFYSTTLSLADGKLLTLYGSASKSLEVYDPGPGSWSARSTSPRLRWASTSTTRGPISCLAGRSSSPGRTCQRSVSTGVLPGSPTSSRSPPSQASAAAVARRARRSCCRCGRLHTRPESSSRAATSRRHRRTAEWIDLSLGTPAWEALPDLNEARAHQVNSVLLPDGRVMIAGGIDATDGGPTEIFDPRDPNAGWELCATMSIPRGYHSAAILLADGSVLMGGDRPGQWKSGETTQHERYYPSYFSLARPLINAAPDDVTYGAQFDVETPSPASIADAVLIRPGAVTHGFNMSQRLIGCTIVGVTPTEVQLQAPPNGFVAPPGPYLLFILTAAGAPSLGRWIRLS